MAVGQAQTENLGTLLKQARLGLGWRLDEVAKKTKIAEKYLSALENSDYFELPSPTYARGFLEHYAEFLGLNAQELMPLFRRENYFSEIKQRVIKNSRAQKGLPFFGPLQKKSNFNPIKQPAELHLPRAKKISNTNLQKIGGAVLALGLVVYFTTVIAQPFLPPRLKVTEPNNNIEIGQKNIIIKGVTEKDAIVKINNQSITKLENNTFEEELMLVPGINMIKISAKKKNSPESVVWRQIFVKE
ncbi:MAG: helix-turn-helix domain-containing protein [Patescibacteria group bacterium]|nr:helix-turn-helix domain-containing protein [Patescibacteria group bacterium]MDD5121249.1 helix-turn-helix domain-containing protein [Patescibacteria group bacterium]MDD5222090.1 helix-turn-helix domain-containing protein [Patescibacteria group bacterium]MDD5395832.1 helix-turn-helix domain-containing protein [Patescibacteria group bacterium]